MLQHVRLDELNCGLLEIRQSPKDQGVVRAIVIRPGANERRSLPQGAASPERGLHGDCWAQGCWLTLPDGRPHPDVQVAIMNARTIALIAQDHERWPLAGDNLYLDLDLSDENLPCGQQLAIGAAVLAITEIPHNGCKKFAERFGKDAVRFVNSPEGKALHLRGRYARVVHPGTISVGDVVKKI